MSKAYEMIAESLNEIITDFEENDGKNLKKEIVSLKAEKQSPTENKINFSKYVRREPMVARKY